MGKVMENGEFRSIKSPEASWLLVCYW